MRQPIIGLTTYPGSELHGWHTPTIYVDAVIRAGGAPVLLPSNAAKSIESWLDCIDGLVVIGGGDINPSVYGGQNHDTIYNLSLERDTTEMTLMRAVIANSMPTLAICRGMQVLNTVLGGTLHEHLPDAYGESTLHRLPPRDDVLHSIKIEANSYLATLLDLEIETASWHHQAIKRLGDGLKPVAWAPDGVIEAVELKDYTNIVAVQWHPEITAEHDKGQQGLFDWLIEQSRQTK